MLERFNFGGVNLTAGEHASAGKPLSETPFCIAILGDFSGRAHRGIVDAKSVRERRGVSIDRDNFDNVLAGLKLELHLQTKESGPIVFRFSELEDFHPDRLFEHAAFEKLRGLRKRMEDPSTFGEVVEELGLPSSPQNPAPPQTNRAPAKAPSAVGLASGSLLDDLIEQTEARGSSVMTARKKDDVHEFARQIAAKYAVSAPDPRRPEFVSAVDRAIADVMRAILHNRDFQALEAIWRATFFLVRQLETGPQLRLHLFDISKAELAGDVATSDVRESGLFRLLVEKGVLTPGADPWAVVVGDYSFGSSKEDLTALAAVSKIAQQAGAPFLAAADGSMIGAESLAVSPHPRDWKATETQDLWSNLRRQPEADSLGLALPQFLLRLPYGEKTSPIDAFDFEEFAGSPVHEDYLWGNGAFAVALLLGESFSDSGWQMHPGSVAQIDRLPLHLYSTGGESESKPCAEVLFTEDAVQRILDNGLIPLVSYKGRDSVRIARFQSIAEGDAPKPLAGRWVP